MLVAFVRISEGVAQKGHANLTGYAELKQPGVEGVAQVVKTDIPDSCSTAGGLLTGFENPDRLAFKGEDQTRVPLPA
jgi:hypothetical protein